MKRTDFTEEQLQEIKKLYLEDYLAQKVIGEKFGVSRTVIKRVLTELGVEVRKTTGQYKLDYNKFKNITTPEQAYWLGFIAADGCNYIREQNATLKIYIHQKDENHLIKFRDFVGSNAPIKEKISNDGFSNNTPMCWIDINNKQLCNDLANVGVVPKKSLILEPPKIPKELDLPFILGLFDGDGSIYKAQNSNFVISINGTKEILTWINEHFYFGKLEKRRKDDKNTYYIRTGGTNKPYNIMKQLYDSVGTHLDRKYELFLELEKVVLGGNTDELSDSELLETPEVEDTTAELETTNATV